MAIPLILVRVVEERVLVFSSKKDPAFRRRARKKSEDMGKKAKWFGAVKKVFSPESKEKKEEVWILLPSCAYLICVTKLPLLKKGFLALPFS